MYMIKQENTEKVGYGSWYSVQSYEKAGIMDEKEKQNFTDFFESKNRACFERVASELKVGDKVRVTYVGGNKTIRYTGIVRDVWFDATMKYGWLNLQQPKQIRGLYTCFIDEIEVLEES